MISLKQICYQIHRKSSIWIAIPVALWALTGILHPLMANWFSPDIENRFIPPRALVLPPDALPPASVFADLAEVHQLKLITVAGEAAYLAITPDQQLHVRSPQGEHLPDGVRRYVEERARGYLGDESSDLEGIVIHDRFSSLYSPINRYLPAYRVKLKRSDGMQVVIDPRTGNLATFDNRSKRLMMRLFSWFHTWSFLGGPFSLLRISVVALLSILSLTVAVTGIVNLFTNCRRGPSPSKALKAHRAIGGMVAVIYLMFSLSAIAHVLIKVRADDSTQWVSSQKIAVAELATLPQTSNQKPLLGVSLAVIDGQPYYRIRQATGARMSETVLVHSSARNVLPDGEVAYAQSLALEFSGYDSSDITATAPISAFQPDYGFIFKRLPVWRVSFEGQPYWQYTVDTADAHMSMRTDLAGLLEALTFINLHKWHFLDFAGRNPRDGATVLASLLVFLLVVSGVWLWLSRRKDTKVSNGGK